MRPPGWDLSTRVQGRAGMEPGWDGEPRAELGQKPGAGTHGASRRRGLLCSAYPWGGRGAGGARLPPPFRLSNSTSGLEEKREGRLGVGGERAPSCGGAHGGGGRRADLPAGTPPWPAGTGNPQRPQLPTVGARGWWVSGSTAPRRRRRRLRAGPRGFGGAWRARPLRSGLELGGGRRLAQLPWNPVIREAAGGEGEELGWPEGAGWGVGPLQVPASWRSWQTSSNPRDVRAGAFGRGAREPGPRPRKRPARARAAGGPGGREGAERRRQHSAGPRWAAAARRPGQRLEPGLPVCLSLKAAKSPPDPPPPPRAGRWMTCQTKAIDSTTL